MTQTHARVDYPRFGQIAPAAYAALLAQNRALADAGFDMALAELVKLRVSQINGCAFCVQYHLNAARRMEVAGVKLDLAAAWQDAGVFSAAEMAALAWAECLTRLPDAGAPDAIYAALAAQFSESEIVLLTVAIGTINSWNRISVGLRFPPPAAIA